MQNEFGRIFPITLEIGNNFVNCDKHVMNISSRIVSQNSLFIVMSEMNHISSKIGKIIASLHWGTSASAPLV